jgi:flavorubredoxin
MTTITEIAPDFFRLSLFVPDANLQFNQFLVRDDEPLLFHTGMNLIFPSVREAVARLLDPARLRWISFSHFEADECGSLNQWLGLAPAAQAACNLVGAVVNVDDFAVRPARRLADGEALVTGKRRFRFLSTPHVPHCWEAVIVFEETTKTLLCSDLLTQNGDVEPLTESDVVGRSRDSILAYEGGPLAHYLPYTAETEPTIRRLAALEPAILATMHGSAFAGDGGRALVEFAGVLRDAFGPR